ncbi:MAG: pitrilysin family protein [Pseudomonadota bacterium]|nr:pitrilysin family protein [Pseudomonadota bacterium]
MSEQSKISRKTLSIMILVVSLFIVVLYNLPGSIKPGDGAEPGPIVTPILSEPLKERADGSKLTSLELIEQAESKPYKVRIESWNTPNGAKVLFVRAQEIPMLDVRVVFDAGAARDGELPGLAQLTSAMLTEGAGIADVDAIARHFEGLGANIDTGSYRDMAIVSLRTLSDAQYRDPALTLFYDVVAQPTFPASSLERLRQQMLLGLQQEKQSPGALAQKAFFQGLYPDLPYGIPPNGTEDSLTRISADDLRRFHEQHYVAANMVIAMIGDIERTQAELIALQLDSQLPKGRAAPTLESAQPLAEAREEHLEFPSSQTHIMVGGIGVKRGDPDWFALSVGNEILGAGGFSSRLTQIIRQDNGLAYSVYSHFIPMASEGPFLINLQTRNDQTQQALTLLNQTLQDFVENGPTEEELEAAKRHILGSFPLQTASNSNIVDYLGMIGFYQLPLNYLDTYIRNIEQVDANAIRQAFQRVVQTKALFTVTAGQQATAGE